MTQIEGLIKRIFDNEKIGISLADKKTIKKNNEQFDLKKNSLSVKNITKYPIESVKNIYDTVKCQELYTKVYGVSLFLNTPKFGLLTHELKQGVCANTNFAV